MIVFFLGRPCRFQKNAHQLDRGVVGLRARVGEEHAVHARRRDPGQARGQLDRGRGRGLEEGVVEGQLGHLPARRLDQLGAAVADVDAPQARHAVQDAVALAVPEPAAVGAGDQPDVLARELGRIGERVQVMAPVELAPATRVVIAGHAISRHALLPSVGPAACPNLDHWGSPRPRPRGPAQLL